MDDIKKDTRHANFRCKRSAWLAAELTLIMFNVFFVYITSKCLCRMAAHDFSVELEPLVKLRLTDRTRLCVDGHPLLLPRREREREDRENIEQK